jgi:hypothetical protein
MAMECTLHNEQEIQGHTLQSTNLLQKEGEKTET